MDPPHTPTPAHGVSQSPQSRSSSPGARKCPQPNDYPLPTDSRSGNGPMGGTGQDHLSATSTGARLQTPAPDSGAGKSKSNKRKNRRRRPKNRKQSFLTSAPETSHDRPGTSPAADGARELMEGDRPTSKDGQSFFKLGRNLSNTSLESEALLDHRDQPMMRPRRDSRQTSNFRPSSLISGALQSGDLRSRLSPGGGQSQQYQEEDSDGFEATDRTPLVRATPGATSGRTRYGSDMRTSPLSSRPRRTSGQKTSSQCSPNQSTSYFPDQDRDFDVNNPPSMPGTPKLGPDMNYDDAMMTGIEFDFAQSMENHMDAFNRVNDAVINIDGLPHQHSAPSSAPGSPLYSPHPEFGSRRHTVANLGPPEDVCLPPDGSELGDESLHVPRDETGERRRRRHRRWPDLSVLEEWSREEKEERSGDLRVKKISEPMLIEGRLRPQYKVWRREEDEAPYRFTYFNEEFPSTIHAQTISELVQPGGNFRELFIPDPPELEDSSSEEGDDENPSSNDYTAAHSFYPGGSGPRVATSHEELRATNGGTGPGVSNNTKDGYNATPNSTAETKGHQPRLSVISEGHPESNRGISPSYSNNGVKPKRYGPRPTFWLDVLSPTDAEMRAIAKAFGIHALTAEDIMMQEAREKVELFRSYYFVNYRTFEQDTNSEDYLEPVNMYVVVFREGVISFHFSQTPHPANVRRRIRQLMDYLILSSDWISYALIDDITDVFGPLIQAIEDEVDEIDEMIMQMHSSSKEGSSNDNVLPSFAPGEMLRRVGECRKKVMGLYRLLSNKADVVKGFAKRCNEQWEVAPKSEIGLYLGDIQDHIMTMTGNLTHYETILSRAHSNYLAQINILMNERSEQTADVLGKLTVLGTIVLPMNIICGMWGMNVKVPGQDIDNLSWFWSITAGLSVFALLSFVIAKRVYKIV
ncbi:uncharacterized protein N7503_003591 [Penicillium pulvis]|uniref:uncharacterized protein n=1 Tax=Penicillium pulvis TaxID=1562058 RepID=UPI0025489CF0|nr:uncharacterized protein N7503_003591 [Penicillium pulvis]KAJ5805989.1 hypothetical protein N7503_003591 [Penicillium pulvis]